MRVEEHVEPRRARRLLVGADRVDRAAALGVGQVGPGDEIERAAGRGRWSARRARRYRRGSTVRRDRGDRGLAGEDVGEAAADRHHAERHDEGRQPEIRDQHAGDEPDHRRPAPTASRIATGIGIVLQRKPEDDAGQPGDRADRKVDAAGQDDEGHADGDDPDHHRLVEEVEEVRSRSGNRATAATATTPITIASTSMRTSSLRASRGRRRRCVRPAVVSSASWLRSSGSSSEARRALRRAGRWPRAAGTARPAGKREADPAEIVAARCCGSAPAAWSAAVRLGHEDRARAC